MNRQSEDHLGGREVRPQTRGLARGEKNKKQTLGSIWLNVYLCLGPSLSLSVNVLIAGLSSVLCGG